MTIFVKSISTQTTAASKRHAPHWSASVAVAALTMMFGIPSPGWSTSYYLATDVPATLGGTDFTPEQLLRSQNAAYLLQVALPAGTEIAALQRRLDGSWLFSPSHPVTLGGTDYVPTDIVAYDGVTFSMYQSGAAAGIPASARIDALFLEAGVTPILSFDVPVNLGGTEYGRSDLVRFMGGTFSLAWDAQANGVPADANLVGADLDSGGNLIVTFDVPTNLGGVDYLPGQLVRWNGAIFSSYFTDPAWPTYGQLRDFSLVPASGFVPDGAGMPGVPLTVTKTAGNLTLSWGGSCASGDTDYEIYEGTLGASFSYNHASKFCSTAGATTMTFAAPAGSLYYLVVPRNPLGEGSYGKRTGGTERPPGASQCLPQQIALTCP